MSYEHFKQRSHRLQDALAVIIWGFVTYTLATYPETRTREFWLYGPSNKSTMPKKEISNPSLEKSISAE